MDASKQDANMAVDAPAGPQEAAEPETRQYSQLDSQLFASLLPDLANLYQLAAHGLDSSRQLEIARLASTVRETLEEAKKQARNMPGADLSIEDQEEIIAVLERELKERRIQS